jgi:hypothetical protein
VCVEDLPFERRTTCKQRFCFVSILIFPCLRRHGQTTHAVTLLLWNGRFAMSPGVTALFFYEVRLRACVCVCVCAIAAVHTDDDVRKRHDINFITHHHTHRKNTNFFARLITSDVFIYPTSVFYIPI